MARMYFNFKTNLPNSINDRVTPTVDYICIYDEKGNPAYCLSCSWESNYGITDGVYDARFKGVDMDKDGDFKEVTSADVKKLKELLSKGTPETEIQIGLWDEEYPELDEIKVESLSFSLEAGEEEVNGYLGTPTRILFE